MADTLVKSVMLKIRADDGDTESKLNDISRKADELAAKHPDIKVKIDSAAASAKLAVLKKELKDTGSQASDTKGKLGAFGDAVGALTVGVSGSWGEMSLFQKVMAGLSLSTGIAEPLVAGVTVAVGGLAAGLVSAGAGLGVFGLVAKTAFTQASTAATSAQTAQSTYSNAVQSANLTYAQSMKTATTAAEQQTAATTRSNAVQQAALARTQALNSAYAGMSPSMITLSKGITTAENSWNSFVNANTSGVAQILSQGLGLLPSIFSMLQPFLAPTEQALSGLVKDLGAAIAPAQKVSGAVHSMMRAPADASGQGSLRAFFQLLSVNAGPSITKIGVALGHITTGITGVLTAFMPMAQQMLGGLDKLTAKFAVWGQTLSGHTGFQSMMTMFHQETPIVMNDLKQLAGIVKTVVANMAGLTTVSNSTSLFKLAGPILTFVNALLKAHPGLVNLILYAKLAQDSIGKLGSAFGGLKAGVNVLQGAGRAAGTAYHAFGDFKSGLTDADAAASAFTGTWGTFGGKISAGVTAIKEWGIWSKIAAAATKVWTGIQAAFDLVMDANPIALIVIAIVLLVAAIVILTIKFKFMRDFWKAAWQDIKNWAADGWHAIDAAFHAVASVVTTYLAVVQKVVTTVFGFVAGYVRTEVGIVKTVVGWFANLGSLFRGWWQAGVNAVTSTTGNMISFVRGIPGRVVSALGNLGNLLYSAGRNIVSGLIHGIEDAAGGLLSTVRGLASDVSGAFGSVLKMLSPSKVFADHGRNIVAGLVLGIQGAQSSAVGASRGLAAAVGAAGAGGAAGSGGGGWTELRVTGAGSADWMAMVKQLWPDLRLEVRSHGGAGPYSTQRALGEVTPG